MASSREARARHEWIYAYGAYLAAVHGADAGCISTTIFDAGHAFPDDVRSDYSFLDQYLL